MKRIIIFAVAAAAFLTTGCKSKIEKAEELIRIHMSETFKYYDSYKVVSTVMDTIYDVPEFNPVIIDLAKRSVENFMWEDRCQEMLEANQTLTRMYEGKPRFKKDYEECVANKEEIEKMAKQWHDKNSVLIDSIRMLAAECTGKPKKWVFTHDFSYYGKLNDVQYGKIYLITDKKVETALEWPNLKDKDYIEALRVLKRVLR